LASAAATLAGCGGPSTEPDLVWGKRGVVDGDFVRPRAVTILPGNHLYIVDFTARIQAFDADGRYLHITWQTPDFRNGRPSGLGVTQSGQVIVADSHYHTVRVYDPNGHELVTRGGQAGPEPGNFGYISDVVEDKFGNWYVSEFGANERITKLDPNGNVEHVWGSHGSGPGEFSHARALAIGPDDCLYVADGCNHRIQVFDAAGKWLKTLGRHGTEPGEFAYPYDVAFNSKGDLCVVEMGNNRVQKLSTDGEPRAMWGTPGRKPGQLYSPWALAVDSRDRVHVIDTENHRVQRIRL
jgi:DNA-binding beta-propeller fold protein YncE